MTDLLVLIAEIDRPRLARRKIGVARLAFRRTVIVPELVDEAAGW